MPQPQQVSFLALLDSLMLFVQQKGARRVVSALRVLGVLVCGEANTLEVADKLQTEPRLVLGWLNMAADDGYILECGMVRTTETGASGKAKVWRIAPAGVALLTEAKTAAQKATALHRDSP